MNAQSSQAVEISTTITCCSRALFQVVNPQVFQMSNTFFSSVSVTLRAFSFVCACQIEILISVFPECHPKFPGSHIVIPRSHFIFPGGHLVCPGSHLIFPESHFVSPRNHLPFERVLLNDFPLTIRSRQLRMIPQFMWLKRYCHTWSHLWT